MRNLIIEWKHFDKDGKTCDRCSGTGANLKKAIDSLRSDLDSEGISLTLVETKLSQDHMNESNEVIIDGVKIEDVLPGMASGENECSSCAILIDASECRCRTIKEEGDTFEEIPEEMIKRAILARANQGKINNKNMKIRVLGSGCPSCKKLFELVNQAVSELGIEADVEYISDIQKIIETGVMSTPILIIDGKIAVSGSVPSVKEIKRLITEGNISEKGSGCSCGGKC